MPPADVRADETKNNETARWLGDSLSTTMWQVVAHPVMHAALGGAFVVCE